MQAPNMQADEIHITAGLAGGLITEQFPQWAGLPLHPVASAGTVHALYRLGDDMVIRLPRVPREGPGQGAVSRLAPFLPIPVPALIRALRKIDPAGGPRAYQSGPLTTLNEHTLGAISQGETPVLCRNPRQGDQT
jgi:hypothetical protein